MYPKLKEVIDKMDFESINADRKKELAELVQFIQVKKNEQADILLNFICTHNSRRSQFAQIWAMVASAYFEVKISPYSGGVEETAFNNRAVASLQRFGFKIIPKGETNPHYSVSWNHSERSLEMFSKMYDDAINPSANFAAIMTCSHADENCPFVAGCEKRIPIRYEDPKNYDDTPLEAAMYDYRSFEIATEMFYVFSKIN